MLWAEGVRTSGGEKAPTAFAWAFGSGYLRVVGVVDGCRLFKATAVGRAAAQWGEARRVVEPGVAPVLRPGTQGSERG